MKKITQISLIIAGLAIAFAFANPNKKIHKIVSKLWKNQEIELIQMNLSDSMKIDFYSISEIIVNGKHAGYACHTSAYGCRIGGCAAPSNPNAQSYETFDYVLIYDENLLVKKIDITNYGGDYGFQICNPRWLSQFVGKSFGFKLNEDIDGISGATVSASFLIDDVNSMSKIMHKFLQMEQACID